MAKNIEISYKKLNYNGLVFDLLWCSAWHCTQKVIPLSIFNAKSGRLFFGII